MDAIDSYQMYIVKEISETQDCHAYRRLNGMNTEYDSKSAISIDESISKSHSLYKEFGYNWLYTNRILITFYHNTYSHYYFTVALSTNSSNINNYY